MAVGETTFIGAMGPRDFDPGRGTGFGSGGIYCYRPEPRPLTILYDVRVYDRISGQLAGDTEKLCFVNFP